MTELCAPFRPTRYKKKDKLGPKYAQPVPKSNSGTRPFRTPDRNAADGNIAHFQLRFRPFSAIDSFQTNRVLVVVAAKRNKSNL